MVVLNPSTEQYNALQGWSSFCATLNFVQDGSGRYIVGLEVLDDPNFLEIRDQLNLLERIEYTPYD